MSLGREPRPIANTLKRTLTLNDYGIPVCTGDLNYTVYDDWTSCDALSNSRTDSHRVPVKFMGENWIISSMAAPSAALPSSTSAINGGQIKLAQEEKYGIINAGQTLQGNPFSVRVADISATTETVPAVAFDILDANMSMVGQIQVDPETNYTFTVSGTGTQVKISLGDTDFAAQTANVTLYSGGNSTNGVLGVGGMLYASGYYVRVSEVGVPTLEPPYSAILDILKGNKAIGQIQVSPGQTYTFTQSGTGKSIKIHVYRVAPGFTLNSKWAEMAIYSDEITLRDGARYNLVSSTDADKDFRVSLLWKNRDYAGAGSSTQADSLREVVVYDTDSFTKKTLKGDKFDFLKSQTAFTIMYKGLDK